MCSVFLPVVRGLEAYEEGAQTTSSCNYAKEQADSDQLVWSSCSAQSARPLMLEYTFNQKDENQLSGLLCKFDGELRRPRLVWEAPDLEGIMQVAKQVNRLRFNQGDDCHRLTQALRQAVLSLDAGYTNAAWGRCSSQRYTPTSIIKSSAEVIEHPHLDMGVCLSLAGQCVPLRDLVRCISSYKGRPCCLMDPANTDPGFQALRSCVLQIKASKQQVAQELLKPASENEAIGLRAWQAALHVEYCCLLNIVSTTNVRLIGEWEETWQPKQDYSAEQARQLMASLRLTQEQVSKFRQLRDESQVHVLDAKIAMGCSLDMAADLAAATARSSCPLPVSDNIHLLDTMEAAQAAKLWAAAAEYTVCECLLCKILTPHQSTLLLQHVADITSNSQCGYSSVAYRCRYHAALILDDKLNRWMDEECWTSFLSHILAQMGFCTAYDHHCICKLLPFWQSVAFS